MQSRSGNVTAHHMFNWRNYTGANTKHTLDAFLSAGEAVLGRLIQTPRGMLVLPMVPGDDASGAIYVYDRHRGDWYMLCFDELDDSHLTTELFDQVFAEYDLFRFVEHPELLAAQPRPAEA